ncbi:PKD domain-containing protein [Burkholderiaceae bacterium DAT-1]|nr:PKD domain-containing protein [Burkholderiaceae bacterium DAT-1]
MQPMKKLALALALGLPALLAGCGVGSNDTSTPAPTLEMSASDNTVLVNQIINFSAIQPSNDPNTAKYSWDFGDGTSASGAAVSKYFSKTGDITVTVTASNAGGTTKATKVVHVITAPVVARANNTLLPDCAGVNCAIDAKGKYSGSGVGVWRYHNASAGTANVDVAIPGVPAGKNVTLVFTNGTAYSSSTLPDTGLRADITDAGNDAGAGQLPSTLEERDDAFHSQILRKSQDVAAKLPALNTLPRAASTVHANFRARAVTQVKKGDTHTWYDTFVDTGAVGHKSTVYDTCEGANGRRIVFWLDSAAQAAVGVNNPSMSTLMSTFCGSQGGFARTTAIMGDVWGLKETEGYEDYVIQDQANAPADVNVAIVTVPSTVGWAGYFWGVNTLTTGYAQYALQDPTVISNEANVFFVNAGTLLESPSFVVSTLNHELTHMINWYQRNIVNGLRHASWLEETSAMMIEDIVVPKLQKNNFKILNGRMPSYFYSGAGTDYINWPSLSGPNYAMGGSFGAFLNRRYGVKLFKQILTDCMDTGTPISSYKCLDGLIKQNGGAGISDELVRMGTTVYGGMPDTQAPFGYGYPTMQSDDYTLYSRNTAAFDGIRPATSPKLKKFSSTSHAYITDTDSTHFTAAGYVRNKVAVPAGTTLTIVVR